MNSEVKVNKKQTLSHKEWRRIAKKVRRRRIRRKIAQQRDADEDKLRATLEKSAEYLNWIKKQKELEEERIKKEDEEHEKNERLWLETELTAQKEWKELQIRKAKAREEKLRQEEIIKKEFDAKQETLRQKKEQLERLQEEEVKRQEKIIKEIDDYIDNRAKTPDAMKVTTDSQPGKETCPFFSKTAACKFGNTCSRNHRKSALSKIIIIPGFYNHFSLEKDTGEYDTDIGLEFENMETRKHFREFYKDVIPELENYGKIKTLQFCCNSEVHLRGNLYVEYYSKRDAARAWRGLKGRWYAGRQLNCEFAIFQSWRNAVCGMSKCPKGRACNYLHTFKNYTTNYDIKSPPRWMKKLEKEATSSRRSKASFEESTRSDDHRNWRWSESPEIERSSQSCSQGWDKDSDDLRENYRQFEYAERPSSRSSRSEIRKKYSSRSRESSRTSRSSSRSSKKKKQRYCSDDEHNSRSKKTHDTDKENGNDSKKDKHRERSQNKSESLIKKDSNKKMETCNDQSSKTENFSDETIDILQMKEMESRNNWDTTDSEEYNSN